jgi:hypothetical protein
MNNLLDKVCGKDNWVAYCINLERAKDRKEMFESFAKHIDLSFTFFTAVDKLDLQPPYEYDTQVANKFCIGALACRLSHRNLLKHFLQNHTEEYLFVFEDDAGFSPSDSIGFGKNSKYQTKENLFQFLSDVSNTKNIPWDSIFFALSYAHTFPIHKNIVRVLKTDLAHAMLFNRKASTLLMSLHEDQRLTTKTADFLTAILQKNTFAIAPPQTLIDQGDSKSYIWR